MMTIAARIEAAILAAFLLSGGEALAQTYPGLGSQLVVTGTPFFADATGAADSTTAIQNAINALPVSGGTVLFPPGQYKISSSLVIGNGNGTTTASTVNGIKLACTANTRPGVNGISGTPSTGPCNLVSSVTDYAIKVFGPINGWGIDGLSVTFSTTNANAGGLALTSASFGDVKNFMVNGVPGTCILEFVNSGGGQASFFNTWRNIQCRLLSTSATAQGIHIGSNQANVDNFGDTWDNVNIIPLNAGHTSLYVGSADSMVFSRLTINPLASSGALTLSYAENSQWPSGVTFVDADFGSGNAILNNGTPGASARPNYLIAHNEVNGVAVPNLANLAVVSSHQFILSPGQNLPNTSVQAAAGHLKMTGGTPSLTAGCNGAGSSVSGTDIHGTVTGQTAAATTCTLTFGNAYSAAPDCVAMGISSPLTGTATPGTGTLVVNFASTANYKFTYFCPGN